MFEANEIIYQNNNWITLLFLIILLILATAKVLFNERLVHLSKLFLSKNYFLIYFNKEKSNVFNMFQILLFIVQILMIALLIYYLNIYFQLKPEFLGLKSYLLIIAGISFYISLRFLLGILLASVFNLKQEHKKLANEKINYFNNLILWIIPLLILYEYAIDYKDFFFKITISIVLFLLIIRYVLLLSNNKKLVFNDFFYFILYLCALEIAPLIIFFKLSI